MQELMHHSTIRVKLTYTNAVTTEKAYWKSVLPKRLSSRFCTHEKHRMTGRDGILTSSVFLLCLFVPSEKWGTPGKLAGTTGLEPAASAVTGNNDVQLIGFQRY
jgi:hypothetical protein